MVFDTRHRVPGPLLGVREEFPRALALERALCKALVARGPQQAAPGITEAAFECVVGPRQAWHVVAVKQARPIARLTVSR